MVDKKEEKEVVTDKAPTPEVKPDSASTAKPTTKKSKMSKLRKRLIIVGCVSIGLALITLILDGSNSTGTVEIIMCVLMALSFIATGILAFFTYKREPDKKVFPLVCLIICSIFVGIALILGIVILLSIL